jgi:hypothetical protein
MFCFKSWGTRFWRTHVGNHQPRDLSMDLFKPWLKKWCFADGEHTILPPAQSPLRRSGSHSLVLSVCSLLAEFWDHSSPVGDLGRVTSVLSFDKPGPLCLEAIVSVGGEVCKVFSLELPRGRNPGSPLGLLCALQSLSGRVPVSASLLHLILPTK